MNVTAALVWWDERPEDLARCVRGIATVADRIVAVDGAYRRYPGATIRSDPAQEAAIREAAAEAGIEAIVHIPTELWAGQIAKRSFLLQEAAKDSDWVAVVDTDWVVSGNRAKVRAELASVQEDVVLVQFCTPQTDSALVATGWHDREQGRCRWHPHFYRALPGLRVETHHAWYQAVKHGRRVWMHHGTERRGVLPSRQLRAPYRIDHLFAERTEAQILANRAYCNDKVMVVAATGQEDDVPGLPPPVFDFEAVPYR